MSKATDQATKDAALRQGAADDAEARSRTIGGRMLVRQDLEMTPETVVPHTVGSGSTVTEDKVKS